MLAAGVPLAIQEQMAIFTRMLLLDRQTGLLMVLARPWRSTLTAPFADQLRVAGADRQVGQS